MSLLNAQRAIIALYQLKLLPQLMPQEVFAQPVTIVPKELQYQYLAHLALITTLKERLSPRIVLRALQAITVP